MFKNSPDWISESVFYHIYPLGYCGYGKLQELQDNVPGDLSILGKNLESIKDMGFNSLFLGPLFQSESHGYDTTDYFNVDKRLGDNESLIKLIQRCHTLGIRVILDGVFNHTGRSFFAFRELAASNGYGKYENWYCNIDHSGSTNGLPFTYGCWNGHQELPQLNLKNPDVKNHLFEAVRFWINKFDIDGIRLDAADCLDPEFMRELRSLTDCAKKDFWLMGEIIHGDYRNWANSDTLHSVTNYEAYKGLYSSFNDINFFEIAYTLNRQSGDEGIYKNLNLYNFADNHDVSRVFSIMKNKANIHPLYILLFTMPGTPSVYYGSEFGIEGIKNNHSDWNLRPDIDTVNRLSNPKKFSIADTVNKLSEIRKNSQPLKKGSYRQLLLTHNQFLFEREFYSNRVIIGINSDDKPFNSSINNIEDGIYVDILNDRREIRSLNGKLDFEIYPNWGTIIVKK